MATSEPVRVRPANAADLSAIIALRRSWTEESLGRTTDDDGFPERLGTWLRSEGRMVFLAECPAERAPTTVIGMVNLAIFERMPGPGRADSRWAYLANMYVRPGHRDHGVGSALIDAAVAAARERGCVRMVLAPTERSVPFYRRAGFGPASMLMVRVLDEP